MGWGEKMKEKLYFGIIKHENAFYALATNDKSQGYPLIFQKTEEDMLNEFTKNYDAKNLLNSESTPATLGGISSAVLIHNSTYNPKVLGMTLEDMTKELFDEKKGIHVKDFGRYVAGLECNGPGDIAKLYENGKSPNLISKSVKQQLN